VKNKSGGVLEVVGQVVQPKSSSVLDFLDELAVRSGANSDERLSLEDLSGIRTMEGRLIAGTKITQELLRKALDAVPSAGSALAEYFRVLADDPVSLFEKTPSDKSKWLMFRELLEFRTLLLQSKSKSGFSIAICHD
jgi:hypothetical protein